MSKIKKALCVILTLGLCFSMLPAQVSSARDVNEIKKSIQEKQEKIKQSQKVKDSLSANIKDAKRIKGELSALRSDVSSYITKIDNELAEVQSQIEEYNGLISDKEGEIEQTTVELEGAIKQEEEQYDSMKTRIKFMYEQGDTFYIDLMLNAKTFTDFLTKANYIEQLSAYERQKLDEYTEAREWTEVVKASLESEKELLDEAKVAKEADEATLSELLAEKENELYSYNSKINKMEKQIADYESELEEERSVIEALEAAIKQDKKDLESQTRRKYDGGMFTFPCPSYIRVTDDFGWRTDPITGASSYHSGVDLGAPAGSAILAAYDGTVVAATYNWSMGNYIMIDHGDDLYTIYMHASALYVSAGQNVSAGDKIAAVGTTGRSTGNHLHFGVRLNGSYVSPWNYLK